MNAEFLTFVAIPALALFLVFTYVKRQERPDLPLGRALAIFSVIFVGFCATGVGVVAAIAHIFEVRTTHALALLFLFGFLAPGLAVATGRISRADSLPSDPTVVDGEVLSHGTSIVPASRGQPFKAWRWEVWAAVGAMALALAAIGNAVWDGYDMWAVAGLFVFWTVVGGVVVICNWFLERTTAGRQLSAIGAVALDKAETLTKWLLGAAVVLAIVAVVIGASVGFFSSMPFWAAIIIVLLVLNLLKK